jgi:exonuclease SbcD
MTSFEFVGVNARRLLTISVDVKDGDLDPTGTVVSAIASHEVADAVVRVQISIASGDEAGLADAPMRSALEGAHFVASISREVRQENRTRLGGEYDSSTGPREALELYLKTAEVPEKRAAVLLEYAATLIDETEPERP